jgi:hypothetical protein
MLAALLCSSDAVLMSSGGTLQVQLMAVMVTQFPIRLSVYAQQVEDVAAHKVSSSSENGGGGSGGEADKG